MLWEKSHWLWPPNWSYLIWFFRLSCRLGMHRSFHQAMFHAGCWTASFATPGTHLGQSGIKAPSRFCSWETSKHKLSLSTIPGQHVTWNSSPAPFSRSVPTCYGLKHNLPPEKAGKNWHRADLYIMMFPF